MASHRRQTSSARAAGLPIGQLLLGLFLFGCPGESAPDASTDALRTICETDIHCSDGRFCNGEERCDPEGAGADSRGCLAGDNPCPGQRCVEDRSSCESCDVPDADGDGAADIACGGDDCDDSDPLRFAGAVEVCDPDDRDEDCDPTTVGTDEDGDGASPASCCNAVESGLRCGTDCDDSNPLINPDAIEVCNGIDEDCDGSLDEDVPHSVFPDDDGDGFGRTRDGIAACRLPEGGGFSFRGGDCDDDNAALNPANTEICNDIDDDCDAAVDEGCPCEPGDARICGPLSSDGTPEELGVCHSGDQVCRERIWSGCIMASLPEEERCNRVDDDCDGTIDEGQTVLLFPDGDGDGFGDGTEPRHVCGILPGYTAVVGDCNDRSARIRPGAPETCDGFDEDCDGNVDETCDMDAGPPDAGPLDAGPPDAGPPDAGPCSGGPFPDISGDYDNFPSGMCGDFGMSFEQTVALTVGGLECEYTFTSVPVKANPDVNGDVQLDSAGNFTGATLQSTLR